jgi:pyridoxamine 5'-phosphate oxidase
MLVHENIRDALRDLDTLLGPFPQFVADDSRDNPVDQFRDWLRGAIEAKVPEPHAMTLSTVDEGGCPDARVLLLKDLDQDGWYFAANATSPKGCQIRHQADVALTFYWQTMGRQIRIRGKAIDLGRERSTEDFLARSISSRANALVGRQSQILNHAADLDAEFNEQCRRIAESPSLVEASWTAYAVRPKQVEFWQGSPDRRHQRLRYSQTDAGWMREFLWP